MHRFLASVPTQPGTQETFVVALRELLQVPNLRQSTVSDWLNGKTLPPADTILAMAILGDVDPGWLAFGPFKRPKMSREHEAE